SLPPPAAKPTMMWIGRVGYLAASSWAEAEAVAPTMSKHAPIREYLAKILMVFSRCCRILEPRDVNMQHRGLIVIKCCKAAVDGGGKVIGFDDAFAMGAERSPHGGKVPRLALSTRGQSRLELVGLGGDAFWIDPLHRRLHRLPAAIVQHDRENWNLVLLRHR